MTANEQQKLFDDAKVFDTIGFGKMFIVLWWTIIKSEKASCFLENLSKGMNAYSAYNHAKRI